MNTKIPFTKAQKIAEAITLAVIVLGYGSILLNWHMIPEKIPTHYNFAGNADEWGSKSSLIALIIVGLAEYALLTLISFFPSVWNTPVKITEKNSRIVYENTRSLLCYIKLITAVMFWYIAFCTAKSQVLSSLFIPFVFVSLGGVIIYYIIKIRKANKML